MVAYNSSNGQANSFKDNFTLVIKKDDKGNDVYYLRLKKDASEIKTSDLTGFVGVNFTNSCKNSDSSFQKITLKK